MRTGRLALATLALFAVALLWNGVLHLLILREANALVAALRRPNLDEMLWLSLLLTLGVCALFAFGYARVARSGRLAEGIGYGLFFGLVAGLLVDLNQYLLYPLPGRVVFYWFLGGLIEFTLYGALITRLYPVARR
jgi:hypothetical protein